VHSVECLQGRANSLGRVNTHQKYNKICVTDLYVQTADDLAPLLDMDPKVGISTQTLVSTDGQQQKAAKLPQYGAALSGNVGNEVLLKIFDRNFQV